MFEVHHQAEHKGVLEWCVELLILCALQAEHTSFGSQKFLSRYVPNA